MASHSFEQLTPEQLDELLDIYRNNLAHLERIAAQFGPLRTSVALINEMESVQKSIAAIEQTRPSRLSAEAKADAMLNANKAETYLALYERVVNAYLEIRAQQVDKGYFLSLLANINSFIIRNALLIERQDHELINEFLPKAYHAGLLVAQSKNEDYQFGWSASQRPLIVSEVQGDLAEVLSEMDRQYDNLVRRFRHIIYGSE